MNHSTKLSSSFANMCAQCTTKPQEGGKVFNNFVVPQFMITNPILTSTLQENRYTAVDFSRYVAVGLLLEVHRARTTIQEFVYKGSGMLSGLGDSISSIVDNGRWSV